MPRNKPSAPSCLSGADCLWVDGLFADASSAGLTVLFTHAAHIELVATPLLAPVLTISGLAAIRHLHEIEPGVDGNGPQ
jgi:hypothetical protein